ncbi:MAG: hypothetical protein HFI19_15750 [Lachnospiraceae bacterium]|uniref:hypothetical protein n=1 Tax=Candidatus Merdisoma sp. JLR.KK006 TaxID=3112626 RepID=UPI002FF0CE7E|nr:hypothetical protein [Lachnospiraceae bacterium]
MKETIAPFRWRSERGAYSLSLDAGVLNQNSFTKYKMLGNGYDWEKAVAAFAGTHLLKEFALAFHRCAMDADAFEELLRGL